MGPLSVWVYCQNMGALNIGYIVRKMGPLNVRYFAGKIRQSTGMGFLNPVDYIGGWLLWTEWEQ